MKLFEKFKKQETTPILPRAEFHLANMSELDPELQQEAKELDETISRVIDGLVVAADFDSVESKSSQSSGPNDEFKTTTTTFEDKTLETSYYSGAGIGYVYTARYTDKDIAVELSSGADFDTAMAYTTATIENPNDDTQDRVKLDIEGGDVIRTLGGTAETNLPAVSQVLEHIRPMLSEVNAKGARQ